MNIGITSGVARVEHIDDGTSGGRDDNLLPGVIPDKETFPLCIQHCHPYREVRPLNL